MKTSILLALSAIALSEAAYFYRPHTFAYRYPTPYYARLFTTFAAVPPRLSSVRLAAARRTSPNVLPSQAIVLGPSAKAALAYMTAAGTNDICAVSAKAFLEAVFTGAPITQANGAAQSAYVSAWTRGLRPAYGSACAASNDAFVRSAGAGKDGVLDAALAFIRSWPGVAEGNPCAISGQAFVTAVAAGKSTSDADVEAATAYIEAVTANPGALQLNPACAEAAQAYIENYV